MMSYQEFEDIEKIHSCWSMMDKVARMAYLKGEKKRLDDMAYQYVLYIRSKGSLITEEDRMKGKHLIEMIDAVQSEGEKVYSEFNNEWRTE